MVFGRGFTFMLGSLFGAYVVQNYRVPRIREWIHNGCVRAREFEKTHRRPENFRDDEGRPAHDCWFRSRYHEKTYRRPENLYTHEAAREPNCSRPIDLDRSYNRPKTFDTNEDDEAQYHNKVLYLHQDKARPMDHNKPYYENGPENFNTNEAGQEFH